MRIGQFARQAGVGIDTVRYYEREGLLPPPERQASGYRRYSAADVGRLQFIRRAKALGFTLDEIRDLLTLNHAAGADRGAVRELAQRRLEDVQQRIGELTGIRDALAQLVSRCSGKGPLAGCPIIENVVGTSDLPRTGTKA